MRASNLLLLLLAVNCLSPSPVTGQGLTLPEALRLKATVGVDKLVRCSLCERNVLHISQRFA